MTTASPDRHGGVRVRVAEFLSTPASFPLPVGSRVRPGEVDGYHIDMRAKAPWPRWPPRWPGPPGLVNYDALAQMALGAYERHLAGEGEEWLRFALEVGDVLVARQQPDGVRAGGWIHHYELGHTYPIHPPSLSAMAQGQGASLLVRLHQSSGDERYAAAALFALRPLAVPTAQGGVRASLEGRPFPEEYPTDPPSFVLNGAIFAYWGYYDVGVALGGPALADWHAGVETLARHIHRWDLGYWSAYDLYPHRITNVASPAYHALHINQLRALVRLVPRPELVTALARFERYAESRLATTRAFAGKAAFRLLVPRHPALARLLGRRLP
jgi:hypothetical protein